ncbi:MAG TPA: HK97 family phage prohead protease [Candidatus Baltobacteraceae bacterium]|nr:HK97 family phage prohead protease [Candidatus Baltobacteraceae bacterium]
MSATLERRFTPTRMQAIRSADPTLSAGTITGYAATFGPLSSGDLGGFRERVGPGAFDKSISSGDDVYACVNHDPSLLLGRRKNGTLRLSTDAIGLRCSCDLPPTSVARDAFQLIQRGDLSEMSFGFNVDGDDGESWDFEPDPDDRSRSIRVRTLRCVRLFDVSAVCSPAYPNTSVSANSAPHFNSRAFDAYFPADCPLEIRSRIPDIRQRFEATRARREREEEEARRKRRNLTNLILSI